MTFIEHSANDLFFVQFYFFLDIRQFNALVNRHRKNYTTTKHGHLQWDEPDGLRGRYCCLDHLMQNF